MAYPRTVARKAAPAATAGANQLEIIPAAKYLKANDIVGMDAVVSENVNGYPYVGFTNKAGVRENIYFSKNSAKYFADGTPLNTPEEQLELLEKIVSGRYDAERAEKKGGSAATSDDVDSESVNELG